MGSIFVLACGFSVLLYILLMYLMEKLIVDKNALSVSMIKILGYNNCEAVKLYNTATAIVIFLSLIISLQLSCTVTKRLYYVFMQDINGWLTFYIAPWILPAMMCMGVACCMAVYLIQMKRINKIPMSKELKCMD